MTTWLPLGAYAAGVVSALVPWVNAEALLLSTIALTPASSSMTVELVIGVAAGQMTGKSAIYWMTRLGGRLSLKRGAPRPMIPRVLRWCDALTASRWRTRGVILASAIFGLPPFYLVSVAAGALMVSFAQFFTIGFAGWLAHFGLIALLPAIWRS